jgi:RNA polymerase sigma-70 factor, ECF subfamily
VSDASTTPKVEEFARLLATCQRRVFLYVLGLTANPADAEEILQETNLVLWRKFDDFEPGTNFSRWATKIAYYEVLKFRKSRAGQAVCFSNDFMESLAAEMDETSDTLDQRRNALNGCMEKLHPKDRDLILRRYQPDASTRGVAETLRRSVQGTRRSLQRIRAALLGCIERTLTAEER